MLIGIALGGCVTPVGTISAGHSLDASGESVVVGRVALTAEHETSGKTYTITCDARGFISDFYVAVPAGRYRISKAATAYLVSHFQAVFEVAPRDVVYVGTFQFTGGWGC
jgi:hypothetical protein